MIQTNDPGVPKKKDNELKVYLIVCLIFAAALAGIDLFFSSISTMSGWLLFSSAFLHLLAVAAFIGSCVKFNDPNFDWLRKAFIGLLVAASITVAGHKVYENENKQVILDSEKAKQEQKK